MAGKIIRTVAVRVRADVSDFEKNMQKTQKVMTGVANKMKSIGKTMSTTITLPIIAVATASTKMAMSHQNSMKQIENNLGSSSKAVNDWVNNNAKAFNMAKVDASQFAATYSNLLGGFLNDAQNADFTKALLQQSSVIANKTGRTVDDVMERIRSGLLGNTESIEDLGVNVNVALLQTTDAFKKIAGNKSWDKLSFQAQQQIRLFAILEQSINKYGTTIEQNATSKLQGNIAKMKDLGLTIGQKLLPFVVKLLDWGNKMLDWLTNLDPQVQNTIMVVAGLAAAAGPLLVVVGSLVGSFGALAPVVAAVTTPVGAVIAVVAALTAGMVVLYNKNSQFRDSVNTTWNNIQSVIQAVVSNIGKSFDNLGIDFDKVASKMINAVNNIMSRISLASTAIRQFTEGNWQEGLENWRRANNIFADVTHQGSSMRMHGGGGGSFGSAYSSGGKMYADLEKAKLAAKGTQQTALSTDWLNKAIDGLKDFGDSGTETYDKLKSSVDSFVDSLKNQTDAYMNFVGVFESANNSMAISGERWLNRLKGQLKATQTYQQSMAFLQGKAQSGVISNQLLSQLQSMGVGGAGQLQQLTKMSDSQLQQASGLYGQRLGISQDMAYNDVMRSRNADKAANQIIIQITGNTLVADDDAITDKMAAQIAKKLKAQGVV